MSNLFALNTTVFEEPAPPCEVFRCEHYDACKWGLLACQSFAVYVATGRAAHPRTRWTGKGRGRRAMRDENVVPTRAQYLRLYPDDSADGVFA